MAPSPAHLLLPPLPAPASCPAQTPQGEDLLTEPPIPPSSKQGLHVVETEKIVVTFVGTLRTQTA